MKILLANPAFGVKHSYCDTSMPNLGLLYLAGSVKHYDPNIQTRYVEGDISVEDHVKIVSNFRPDIYAINISTLTAPYAYETINRVKAVLPNLKVIAGGPHPTINPESVLINSKSDYCGIGEGEQTFVEFIDYMQGKRDLQDIAGLAYRNAQGEIHRNEKRRFIMNLDQIPFPDWGLVDHNKYRGLTISKRRPYGHLLVSRGCPYNCVFCSNPVWKYDKPWLRLRSPEAIAEEVKVLYKYGIREIFLRADEMNPNLKWAKEVCRTLKDLKLPDLFFTVNLRVDKVDVDFAHLLKEMNCWLVHIGIESSSPRVLEGIRKHYTIEQVAKSLDIFRQFGLKVYGYFMMFNIWEDEKGDLQYEIPDEVYQTIEYIRKKAAKNLIHYISWAFCTPYEGADLYDIAKRHNIISEDKTVEAFEISARLPGISPAIMNKCRRKGMLLQMELALRHGNINFADIKRGFAKLKYILTPSVCLRDPHNI